MIVERPIIFSASSIALILATRKTQTRRPITPQPEGHKGMLTWHWFRGAASRLALHCPRGGVGDRLWIKEVFGEDAAGTLQYRQQWREAGKPDANPAERGFKWRAPFYMKREQARLVLEITEVRVEPVQSITGRDAAAEGFAGTTFEPARERFAEAWQKMHGASPNAWLHNPWVWAITFKVIEAPV